VTDRRASYAAAKTGNLMGLRGRKDDRVPAARAKLHLGPGNFTPPNSVAEYMYVAQRPNLDRSGRSIHEEPIGPSALDGESMLIFFT
jgi:hypothetical protein